MTNLLHSSRFSFSFFSFLFPHFPCFLFYLFSHDQDFQYEGRNWRNQATYNVTDVRKRKRLELERRALEQPLPQYRIVQSLNLRPVISQRAKETIVTEAVSSSSDANYNNIQTRSRIQVINSGLCANRDNDPVSSSTEMTDSARMNVDITRAKRVHTWCPMVDDSDTDDSD